MYFHIQIYGIIVYIYIYGQFERKKFFWEEICFQHNKIWIIYKVKSLQ
jgi:hypothetical protein